MLRTRRVAIIGLILVWSALITLVFRSAEQNVKAIPMFARRLGVSCATCHTSPPRLNETGYNFRAAGFRMPEEIGKTPEKRPFKFGDHAGVRIQLRWDEGRFEDELVKTKHHFDLFAAEGYFLYEPWGKHLSSNIKLTIYPEDFHDTEGHERLEGNLKFVYGSAKHFFEIRGGVPHPMEGYGASDVAVSDTRPYFQEQPVNFNQSTLFTPWNFHQAAVTAGYYQGRTTIRALLLEGIRASPDENSELGAFGRKEPFSKSVPFARHTTPDLQVFVNRILNSNAGGVSFYYYRGNVTLPILDPTGKEIANSSFQNFFDRMAFYGSYPIKRLTLFGGAERGSDAIAQGGRFTSFGAYGEAAVTAINDLTQIGVRYDWFDPSRNKADNRVQGVTVYINAWARDTFRFVGEYRHLNLKQGLLADRKNDEFQLRLIYIK
ncbi:MAG: hypothetical protein ACRD63_07815 [Pyrinomonadaceae bacterium]